MNSVQSLQDCLVSEGVKVNPDRTMKFKVADYQKGVRESGALFTRNTLKGGPISPAEVVDSYINANRSLFGCKEKFKGRHGCC